MKKHLAFLITAMAFTATTHAQPEAGTFSIIPRFGVALSNISDSQFGFSTGVSDATIEKGKYREGVLGGVDFQYQASDIVAVSLGAFYERQGCKFDDSDLSGVSQGTYTAYSDCKTSLDYINVPVIAHFYLFTNFSVNVGFQPGFLVHKSMHIESQSVTANRDGTFSYAENIDKTDISNLDTRSFDFSVPIGISYEYANVVLDIRYNIGLSNVYKEGVGGKKNKVFAFSVGYKFNL